MAEQKYVMMRLEDYEKIMKIGDETTLTLLERVYGHLTGDSFIDKNDHWEIDREQALKAATDLRERLLIDNVMFHTGYPKPYDELVYTESERDLLHEVLNEREDWD